MAVISLAASAFVAPTLRTTLIPPRTTLFSLQLLASDEDDERPTFSELKPIEPLSRSPASSINDLSSDVGGLDPTSWGGFGASLALYLLLYTSTLTVAQLLTSAGSDAAMVNGVGTAAARVVATGGFAAIQQVAGLPLDQWLTLRSNQATPQEGGSTSPVEFLQSPLAPVAAGVTFFAVAVGLGVGASVGAGIEWDSTLPAARALPEAPAAADILLLAPLTEELFFRAWLLRATAKAGAPPPLRIGISATLFALWHVGAGDSPLFFAALGAYLAFLFQRSEGSLGLCVGAHATYNFCVTVLRAVRL